MLIDDFLPVYDVMELHSREIQAPLESVFTVVRRLDLRRSSMIRWLFRLRGLPPSSLTIEGLLKMGFIRLGETPNQEILLGLAGRFWTRNGDLQVLDAADFKTFEKPGYAKAAWNFVLSPQGQSGTHLVTETRVLCLDEKSRRNFLRYWLLVGPASGWIRKAILRVIAYESMCASPIETR